MKEASAMTEVSGLTDNEDELEKPSRTTRASRNEMLTSKVNWRTSIRRLPARILINKFWRDDVLRG